MSAQREKVPWRAKQQSWPAFLTKRRGEVRERTGRTRCEPPAQAARPVRLSRITAFRPFPFTGRHTFLLERTRLIDYAFHETRDTRHESRLFSDPKHGFSVARMVLVGTEALQSFFFRPGLLSMMAARHSPCGSRIRSSKAFTCHKSLISRVLTKHETRDAGLPGAPRKPARMSEVFTKHETRNTNHGLFRGSYGARWY